MVAGVPVDKLGICHPQPYFGPRKPYFVLSTPYIIPSLPYFVPSKPYFGPESARNPLAPLRFFTLKLYIKLYKTRKTDFKTLALTFFKFVLDFFVEIRFFTDDTICREIIGVRFSKWRMPPPEGSGILTLYGHRLPRLYRALIESQPSMSAKGGGTSSDSLPAGHRTPSEAFWLSS